jgi:hypothetical protein
MCEVAPSEKPNFLSDEIFCLSSRERWYIQGQSLFNFTLGYSQGGTPSERFF